jgi:hypothetical protein
MSDTQQHCAVCGKRTHPYGSFSQTVWKSKNEATTTSWCYSDYWAMLGTFIKKSGANQLHLRAKYRPGA